MKKLPLTVEQLSYESADAIVLLYKRLEKTSNIFKEQLIEQALDTITTKPTRTSQPEYIARNACSDARKDLRRRIEIVQFLTPTCQDSNKDMLAEQADNRSASESKIIEILDWICNETRFNNHDRSLLLNIAQNENAKEIAARTNLCVKAVRKNISRARARARAAWQKVT